MRFTRRHLIVALFGLSAGLALIDCSWLGTYQYAVTSPDFFVYYLAAKLGSMHGWATIYDPSVFLPVQRAVVGRPLPYLNPPELAWLVLPLSWLPYGIAAWVWKGMLAATAAITWYLAAPGQRSTRVLHGVAAAVLLPVFISFFFGQVSVMVVAASPSPGG
jgi:glycosyl transferase family 87